MAEPPTVTDNQLRGHVLLTFYQNRRAHWHESNGSDVVPPLAARDFVDICLQLEAHGLLRITHKKHDRGSIAVIGGKITAFGIDAVESKGATSPISIAFNFTGSQTVQIGNQNTVSS